VVGSGLATRTLAGFTALDDGELAALAVDGHGEAFAELYDRHEQRVYGFCLRMLGSPHDAAGTSPYSLGACALYQPRPPLPTRHLRGLSVRNPANVTGNFVAPISLTAVVGSSPPDRRNLTSVFFRCPTNMKARATLHNPMLTAIRLGP